MIYPQINHIRDIQSCIDKLIGSNSILYEILTSSDVNSFQVFFRVLPKRPEKVQLEIFYLRAIWLICTILFPGCGHNDLTISHGSIPILAPLINNMIKIKQIFGILQSFELHVQGVP